MLGLNENAALRLRLMEAARGGSETYSREFVESLDELSPAAQPSEERGIRDVASKNADDAVNAVKVSLLYNDVSLLHVGSSGKVQMLIVNPDKTKNKSGFQITVPSSETKIIQSGQAGELNCGLMLPNTESDAQFFNDVAPLVGQGRLVIQPTRFLMYLTGEIAPEGGRMWGTHVTDPLAPLDVWTSKDAGTGNRSIKTVTNAVMTEGVSRFVGNDLGHELVLPFIDGLSLTDYAKLIEDNSDQLASFRLEMKKYIQQLRDGSDNIEQFRKDVIQAKIDKLERDFKKITASSNIRVGGLAIGSVLMCAATLATGGAAAAIAAVAGTAGLVGGAKELGDRYEKTSGLKDDPLHLLWQLNRNR